MEKTLWKVEGDVAEEGRKGSGMEERFWKVEGEKGRNV